MVTFRFLLNLAVGVSLTIFLMASDYQDIKSESKRRVNVESIIIDQSLSDVSLRKTTSRKYVSRYLAPNQLAEQNSVFLFKHTSFKTFELGMLRI